MFGEGLLHPFDKFAGGPKSIGLKKIFPIIIVFLEIGPRLPQNRVLIAIDNQRLEDGGEGRNRTGLGALRHF